MADDFLSQNLPSDFVLPEDLAALASDFVVPDELDIMEVKSSTTSSCRLVCSGYSELDNEKSEIHENGSDTLVATEDTVSASESIIQLRRKPWYQRMFDALVATQASLRDETQLRQKFEDATAALFLRAQRSAAQLIALGAEVLLRRTFSAWRAQAPRKVLSMSKRTERPAPAPKRKRQKGRTLGTSTAATKSSSGGSCLLRAQFHAAFIAWSRCAMSRRAGELGECYVGKTSGRSLCRLRLAVSRVLDKKELHRSFAAWQRLLLLERSMVCKHQKDLYEREWRKLSRILTDQQLSRNPAVVGCVCCRASNLQKTGGKFPKRLPTTLPAVPS